MSAVTFETYLDDPDAAATLIEAEVERELQAKGLPRTTKATFSHLLAHIKTNGFELQRLHRRIKALEAEAAKPRPVMVFCGDWIAGSEYDAGSLVVLAADLWLAIQPIEPKAPPSRATGWTLLVQGAQP